MSPLIIIVITLVALASGTYFLHACRINAGRKIRYSAIVFFAAVVAAHYYFQELNKAKESAKTSPSITSVISDKDNTAKENPETSAGKTWRERMLVMYLDHQAIDRRDAWWLDVAPLMLDVGNYPKIFSKETGQPIPDGWQDQMAWWRDKMYPALYQNFQIQLPAKKEAAK